MTASHLAIWVLSLASIALMLIRPRDIAEVWWVCGGAIALVALRLMPLRMAGHAIAEGIDVYLFLTGMMLLAQLAHMHGVFDWLATVAIRKSKGSRARLFALVYIVGAIVTVFLSNDATAVVLTPAVLAGVKKSKAEPLPYLLICAFIANAASFVLPISNPANLVVFHHGMPPLRQWLDTFFVASLLSIATTYAVLYWYCRKDMQGPMESDIGDGYLSTPGKLTLAGIALAAIVLLLASGFGKDLGLPTFAAALFVAIVISVRERTHPSTILREISWSVLPLVAGLFVLVEAIDSAGALRLAQTALRTLQQWKPIPAAIAAAFGVGIGTNLMNNLPLGLIAGTSVRDAHIAGAIRNAILIGVDLGPNLSVTGSLATILWLIALRKEGMNVSAWKFLKAGFVVMPLALALATIAAAVLGR